jgi:hypothetical protein
MDKHGDTELEQAKDRVLELIGENPLTTVHVVMIVERMDGSLTVAGCQQHAFQVLINAVRSAGALVMVPATMKPGGAT